MLVRYYNYNNNFIRRFFINKYFYKNIYCLPDLNKINLSIVLDDISSLEDSRIIDGIKFISYLSSQRPQIYKFTEFVKGKNFVYKVIIKVTLRKFLKFNFMDIFYVCYMNYNSKSNKKYILNSNLDIFFLISDLNFFFFLREFFVDFKENLKIDIIYKNIKKKEEIFDYLSIF